MENENGLNPTQSNEDELNPQAQSGAQSLDDVIEIIDGVNRGVKTVIKKAKEIFNGEGGESSKDKKTEGEEEEEGKEKRRFHSQLFADPAHAKLARGIEFFDSVAEPAVKGVISKMQEAGHIKPSADGTRTLESKSISWQLTKDNQVRMIDKSTGKQITPRNLTQQNLDTIKKFSAVAQKQGYVKPPAQNQSQTVEQPKQVQSQIQTQILKV